MAGKRGNGEDSIYKSDGRWYVQGLIDEGDGPVRRKVSAKTKTQAVEKWKQRKADAEKGARRYGQPKNVAELLEHWLKLKEPDLRYKTRIGYRHSIDAHINPCFGTRPLKKVTVADIERWQHDLGATQGLSGSTVHQARTILNQAFAMAVRYGDLVANPVTNARGLKKTPARIDALSEDQARQLLRSLPPEGLQDKVRILLALTLGLRQGELLALKWEDIDLDSSEPHLVIGASIQRQTGVGIVRVPPKTEKSKRTIRLSEAHVTALKALSIEQKHLLLASGGTYNAEGYVLVSSSGTPIDPANDRKHWHKLLKAAGLPAVRVHAARHTAATLLLKEADMHLVQQVLGHSSIRTTVDTYGHLNPADASVGIAKVTARLTA